MHLGDEGCGVGVLRGWAVWASWVPSHSGTLCWERAPPAGAERGWACLVGTFLHLSTPHGFVSLTLSVAPVSPLQLLVCVGGGLAAEDHVQGVGGAF